jgi:hypothetical protein
MLQWTEEVQLLQEEMSCVLAFYQYQAALWDERGTLWMRNQFLDLWDGVCACAAKQSTINHNQHANL